MKHPFVIGLFLLLALSACNMQVPEPVEGPSSEMQSIRQSQLQSVDSLMWRQPDSALALLLPWFDTCRDAMLASPTDQAGDTASETHSMRLYNRHYAHLLLAELLYKNDYAQANREELRQAVAYFDSLVRQAPSTPPLKGGRGDSRHTPQNPTDNLVFLSARAHYINGVGYYEQDSVVEACEEYIKALEIMEERFEEKELVGDKARFMALTYTRLTVLFSNLYLNQQAIYFGKCSLPYYEKNKTSFWHLSWMYSEIGAHYNMMEKLDSATFYYQQAKDCLPDTNNQTYRDIVNHQVFLSYMKERQSEKTIQVLQQLATLATTDDERLARFLSIGDVYYYEQVFDSARVYFEQVYNNTHSSDSRLLVEKRLQEISMVQGDTLKANEYALAISQFVTIKDKEGNLHSDLTTLCQQYEQNRQEAQHRLQNKRVARRWGVTIDLAVFVLVAVFLLLMLLRRRMRNERYLHKMERASMSGRLRKSNEALRNVSLQLENLVAKNTAFDETGISDDYSAYVKAPVCQYILQTVQKQRFKSKMDYLIYKDSALGKEQILALRDAAEKHLTRFISQIRIRYPKLTDNDMDYCYLFLLGLNEADISALLQRAYSTVCERSRKISRIIGTNGDIYHTLHNMLSK